MLAHGKIDQLKEFCLGGVSITPWGADQLYSWAVGGGFLFEPVLLST